MTQKQFYINIDRCTGCYACELACKEENEFQGILVNTVGSKKSTFLPVLTEECTTCKHRVEKDIEPVCVKTCFTKAIYFDTETELNKMIKQKNIIYGTAIKD
jgi:anaerobic dimethyl sulfoxide reductase subunit B (iron-sulfur subunit)